MTQAPTVLACDVGNSTIRMAMVTGDEVSPVCTVRAGQQAELGRQLDELWQSCDDPSSLAAASVNPPALAALEAAAEAIGQDVLVVGRELPLPIETDLDDPDAIGADRLCCASAAYDRLGAACVVADFGTAITIDCVNDDGVFLGGAILPGLHMGADALSSATAQLPRVELERPEWVFGKDTRQAIVGGLVRGARGALRELAEAYATELGRWPAVIITGGDAALIGIDAGGDGLVQAVVDDLLLRGIAMAYYKSLLK